MRRLLTHLAQFSTFTRQGELLCTQSLAYLLQDDEARATFGRYVATHTRTALPPAVTWRAEVRQSNDFGRPDLEGCSPDGRVVKIEGKLGADLSPGQVQSYVRDLEQRCRDGLLLVLVPRRRQQGVITAVTAAVGAADASGRWRLPSGCGVAVIFWEDVIQQLRAIRSEPFRDDLEQFDAMYTVLNRHILPLESDVVPPDRLDDLVLLVDRLTRLFVEQRGLRLLPLAEEGSAATYQRRYICPPLGDQNPCFSVGVRHPFAGHQTFLWLRFNRTTQQFPLMYSRLTGSSLSGRLVESGGDVWFPLDLPLHTDEEGMIGSLLDQVGTVVEVAYAPLR
jgi:hypothetical protein